MSSQAIEHARGEIQTQQDWYSADQVLKRVRAIQQLMEAVMKKDTHYGVIPGTKQPTLYKAGSEQILSMFGIAVEPIIEELSSTEDECRIRVICRLTSVANGKHLGSGVGEASSSEQKYMWRRIVSKAEWEHYQKNSPEKTRIRFFISWQNGKRVEGQEEQIRTHVPDIRNTILKMAKKRAQIDATLTVTGCSDMFAQDLEDLPAEVVEQVADDMNQSREPIKPTTKKSPEAVASPVHGEVVTETRPATGKAISEKQLKRLLAIQSAAAMTDEVIKAHLTTLGITSRKLIPWQQYNGVIDFIDPEFKFHTKEAPKGGNDNW